MLNRIRMIFGVTLLAVIGIIIWAYVTGGAAPAPAASVATTTPSVPSAASTSEENKTPPPLSSRVTVDAPKAGVTVGKTFTVEGEAPGNWYFEASFPIQVRSAEGDVIGRAVAQAQSDWMTTELVSFTTEVTLDGGYSGPATLILLRDNPSGLPEHDDALEVDIIVK